MESLTEIPRAYLYSQRAHERDGVVGILIGATIYFGAIVHVMVSSCFVCNRSSIGEIVAVDS